ncbi:MAG TPA: restriction endonuclease [Saprospiraceae bacterium]|nr:restriction endonuclease [Saprospiraceae bacterium]
MKFNQFVGVIQVGNICIEILPKISQIVNQGDKEKWQKVLIDMLRECRWMQVYAHEKASLRFKPNSILEAYLELFLYECEQLLRHGLVKRYRLVVNNCNALKGKLLFQKQVQVNSVHKERFYTRHQIFDRENVFNQILLKALKLVPILSQSPYLKDKVYNLLLSFPELADIVVTQETFTKLVFDRKTSGYKEAIEIAAMLLLNYRADISTGQNHVLAILFDMNDLWEEFIYRQLYKSKPANWTILSQNSKQFWKLNIGHGYKTIRPDIVIHNQTNDTTIIVDTKWKIPDNNIPADADLKQMFVYNEYWLGKNALLLYPHASYNEQPEYFQGSFVKKGKTMAIHGCGIMKIAVLDKSNLNLDGKMGKRIIEFLKNEIMK